MVRTNTMNTLVLPTGAVLVEVEGDLRSWGLNLAALPRETLHQLQDGVTIEVHAQEGYALQTMIEHKENMEQVSLQRDDLISNTEEVE